MRPDLIDTLQRSKLNVFLDQSSVQRIFLGFGTNRTPLFPPVVRLNILGSVRLSRTLYIAVFSVRVTPVPALAPPISTWSWLGPLTGPTHIPQTWATAPSLSASFCWESEIDSPARQKTKKAGSETLPAKKRADLLRLLAWSYADPTRDRRPSIGRVSLRSRPARSA